MSIVHIVNHNEVIYSILNDYSPEPKNTPRYESKLERELKQLKNSPKHQYFGYAETPLRPPNNFLKKGKGIKQKTNKSDHECCNTKHLPPLPKTKAQHDKNVIKPSKNFKVINIIKSGKTNQRKIEMKEVDTRNGNVSSLKGSGKIPQYALREDFGRIPEYLIKRNQRILKKMEKLRLEEEQRESLCKLISEEERKKLLNDLRHNWQIKQKAFLQLPIMTDTIPKILKKTKMEEELRELEKDIALVESHPYIYIYE